MQLTVISDAFSDFYKNDVLHLDPRENRKRARERQFKCKKGQRKWDHDDDNNEDDRGSWEEIYLNLSTSGPKDLVERIRTSSWDLLMCEETWEPLSFWWRWSRWKWTTPKDRDLTQPWDFRKWSGVNRSAGWIEPHRNWSTKTLHERQNHKWLFVIFYAISQKLAHKLIKC